VPANTPEHTRYAPHARAYPVRPETALPPTLEPSMRIIHTDVDTPRADHTTPSGYHRPTTHHLRKQAEKSVTFDRHRCSGSPRRPSRTTLTSGRFGIANGVIGHLGQAAQFRLDAGRGPGPDRPLLGRRPSWGGYGTAAIPVLAERHRACHDPVRCTAHPRDTGRAQLAEDLEARPATLNTPVSWRAPDRPRTADLPHRWVQLLQTRDQQPVTTD